MKYCIACLMALFSLSVFGQNYSEDIRLNQLGFLPAAKKQVVVVNAASSEFEIRTSSGAAVYTGTLSTASNWSASDESARVADFTEFDALGTFHVYVNGKGTSYPFTISDNSFLAMTRGSIKAYYFNRASTALEEEYAGVWARPLGHPDDQVRVHSSAATDERPEDTVISTPYGWYDAGDYNKYIVNSGISTFTLLSAYETYPELYDTLTLNIPEKGNNIPDILDETLWNINWMFTMQDPNDGGVYNKTTTSNFQGAVMPHETTAVRWVVAKGTAATLDFAAIMAMTARIYKPYLPDFADECLAKAELAWQWANDNPNVAYNNPSGVNTGGYGDGNFDDEFVWAASELYITTGTDSYYEAGNFNQNFSTPGWPNVGTLALLSLITHEDDLTSAANIQSIKTNLVDLADDIVNGVDTHPFRIPNFGFYWGSNGTIGNMGMILLQAYELTEDSKYYDVAVSAFDYLMGRNGTGYSYVTGFGSKTPMNIHHRQSEADDIDAPVPGFLAGGPNPGNQDQDCGANLYPSTLPAKSYLDDWCSYSTNEITINWNAPLVFLSGGLQYTYLRDFQRESNYVIDIVAGVGSKKKGLTPAIKLYPNPVVDALVIESAHGSGTLELYDLSGSKVRELAIVGKRTELDLTSLTRGFYTAVYTNAAEVHSQKIVLTGR